MNEQLKEKGLRVGMWEIIYIWPELNLGYKRSPGKPENPTLPITDKIDSSSEPKSIYKVDTCRKYVF